MGGWLSVHCTKFSSIPGLNQLDVCSTVPTSCDRQKCLRTFPKVSLEGRGDCPQLKNTDLGNDQSWIGEPKENGILCY